MDLPVLANRILHEARRLIHEDLIVTDVEGTIIASTDADRIGTFHEGAVHSVQLGQTVVIKKQDEAVMAGVRAGIVLPLRFNNEVIGVIGITGDPLKVTPYGELLRRMTELSIQEHYLLEQLEVEERAYEAFLFDWLQNKDWTDAFRDRAKALHVDLFAPKRLVLAVMDQADALLQRKVWQYVKSLLQPTDILVRWGHDRFVLVLPEARRNRRDLLELLTMVKGQCGKRFSVELTIGAGTAVDPGRLPVSYEQAMRAAEAAYGEGIMFHEDLKLEICLQDLSRDVKEEFVQRTISTLQDQEELLLTLRAFIEKNASYKQTAASLNIHINSLYYRLSKIEEATGLNPQTFKELAILYMALLVLDEHTKI